METIKTDVLIIGSGMAGSCLARQLKLARPQLSIMVVDAKTSFSYWVGESTVEAWEDYMTRVLKLGPFIEKNFLTKHGLRMFFDSEKKDLSIAEMAEFGRTKYHSIPARNLDRRVFDQYMVDKNLELGIDVRLGVKVSTDESGIELDPNGGHKVETSIGTINCTYLVDASGRSSPLAKKLNLVPEETRHSSVSYWARVKNANWLDDMGDDAWRARVNYTIRYNSTSHFMYRGYWVWLIPLDSDMVSIGIEGFTTALPEIKGKKSLEEFLRTHRGIDELLGTKAEFVDFNRMNKLPRCATQHFSEDRWYLTGMSGMFIDVMGSGTSRVYSEFNRMIGAIIEADLDRKHKYRNSLIKHSNIYARTIFELHFRNLRNYDLYGSFDLWPNLFGAGLSKYFNSHLPNCITDLANLKQIAHEHQEGCDCQKEEVVNKLLHCGFSTKLVSLINEFKDFLDLKGAYYSNNHGNFLDIGIWEDREDIAHKFYKPRDLDNEKMVDLQTYKMFCKRIIKRMCTIEQVSFNERAFESSFIQDWNSNQTLAMLFESQTAEKTKPYTSAA